MIHHRDTEGTEVEGKPGPGKKFILLNQFSGIGFFLKLSPFPLCLCGEKI
jgi:hypothetical protein